MSEMRTRYEDFLRAKAQAGSDQGCAHWGQAALRWLLAPGGGEDRYRVRSGKS